ncbi:MAG TPA: class I SAM-dependent methyltransferase [Steroidobacteraceae bacterium]|nr:class I SAM-dependent methyltransferase [Steroidobacteraceae bacterium]
MSTSLPYPAARDWRDAGAKRRLRARHLYYRARLQQWIGRAPQAAALCRRALEHSDYLRAWRLLAYLQLPGEDYQQLLARLHDALAPATYLEIGVDQGHSFRLLGPGTQAIGIDPAARLAHSLAPGHSLFAMTSDEFFARIDVRAVLGGRSVRMAFIDGMHHFEFALRDFVNLEPLCDPDSVLLVHDCYPLDARTAARERSTGFWTGDVWRLVALLRRHRPDLLVRTIATPPTGLALISRLDPSSRLLQQRLPALIAEGLALEYAAMDARREEILGVFPNHWSRIRALLGAH